MASTVKHTSQADQRLLNFLAKSGLFDRARRDVLAGRVAAENVSVVQLLEREGVATAGAIAETLAQGLHLPLLNLRAVPFEDGATRFVDEPTANRLRLVPVRAEQESLVVAMENPFDQEALQAIEFRTGLRVRPGVAPRDQILEGIQHLYRMNSSLNSLLQDIPDKPDLSVASQEEEEDENDGRALSKEAEGKPVVKMVNLILVEAMSRGASDVHVEPGPNFLHVRYRVHGVLEDALQLPRWVQNPVVARIKVMAKLDITERRVPQDGRLHVRHKGRTVDLRVSSLPTSYGEKIVMRVLDSATALQNFDGIGIDGRDLRVLREAIAKPEGMILVTGPTGSGKTTTLYAMIQEIYSPELNIVTIENPIEYELSGVAQVEVNEKQGLTFAKALRSILRQDPDVILVGEIRDEETAEVVFQAAQTGHLVLSTLHTNDTTATITRLVDLGVERYLIASSLMAVVAQRLVRTVCPDCSEFLRVNEEIRRSLGIQKPDGVRRGRGCASCRNSGFAGRTGVYEVLAMTDALKERVEVSAAESVLRKIAIEEGMTPLVDDAARKVEVGETTPDEVLRAVQIKTSGLRCPECSNPVEERFTICPYCRHALRHLCPGCNAAMQKEWQTCPFCGTPTEEEEAVAPSPPPVQPQPAPAPPPAAGNGTALDTPEVHGGSEIDKVRVLVVDDNEDLRRIVRMALERGPFEMEIEEAANGFEAIGKIQSEPPHVIILDIMMPEMDGFEVCRRIRSDLKTALIPILMLTAREDPESRTEGFLAGTDDYVVKPFNRGELMARIQRLLQRTYGLALPESSRRGVAAAASRG